MTTRFRFALVLGVVACCGCSDSFNAGQIDYVKSPQMEKILEGKPRLQASVTKTLNQTFGAHPEEPRVPKGAPLPLGGLYLGNHYKVAGEKDARVGTPKYHDSTLGREVLVEGGYALYREHCLHCHGASGDGNGPTAAFLWPKPRDYRPGVFKFTSTTSSKPTRSDLRRTIMQGIPNTSMPSFEALMTANEMEQVIDYVIFLSLRGETELGLINEASIAEESEADTIFGDGVADGIVEIVFNKWTNAESEVLNPPVPRTPSSEESILRGREMFLGLTSEKLQCSGCHGPNAEGNGSNFVPEEVFNAVVFRGKSIESYSEQMQKLWVEGSLDDWGNPLRPANLNKGQYKGGRRPIDIYWRIAKGINGAKMPSHSTVLKPEQIWDLVNFVLALPYEPDLLKDAPAAAGSPPPVMARR